MSTDRQTPSATRRGFLGSVAAAVGAVAATRAVPSEPFAAGGQPTRVPDFEFDEATIADLQQAMASRTAHVAAYHPARTSTGSPPSTAPGPALRSVIEINPDALADRRRSSTPSARRASVRGPLHGIPILLKDNIDTADRMTTTAGSLALVEARSRRATPSSSTRLREAGAVILGKTNLSEWANFRSTHSTSGWSARGGQTRNPYALDRNPCGSSSGSGAAVAANLCAAAVGTETDGSIVCPSSATASSGIKPTVGLVSRSRHHPDLALAGHGRADGAHRARRGAASCSALAGVDPRDAATARSQGRVAGLHDVPRRRRPEGRADRRRAPVLRLQPATSTRSWRRRSTPSRSRRRDARRRGEARDDAGSSTTARASRCCCTSSRPT